MSVDIFFRTSGGFRRFWKYGHLSHKVSDLYREIEKCPGEIRAKKIWKFEMSADIILCLMPLRDHSKLMSADISIFQDDEFTKFYQQNVSTHQLASKAMQPDQKSSHSGLSIKYAKHDEGHGGKHYAGKTRGRGEGCKQKGWRELKISKRSFIINVRGHFHFSREDHS